jgi:EAL domain-containing protein (putative c-di-GMP-specific phosphodiesterase class I)
MTIKFVYQPIFDIKESSVIAYEILLRIKKNQRFVSPRLYIQDAEKNGQIKDIDIKVIQLMSDLIIKHSTVNMIFAINISAISASCMQTIQQILRILKSFTSRVQVIIEITETSPIYNYNNVQYLVKKLRKLNCIIAIDDFGHSCSSFGLINLIKPDIIKINTKIIDYKYKLQTLKTFEALVMFAHSVNALVVAESVDDYEIYNLVLEYDIRYCQGFYLSKPLQENNLFFA